MVRAEERGVLPLVDDRWYLVCLDTMLPSACNSFLLRDSISSMTGKIWDYYQRLEFFGQDSDPRIRAALMKSSRSLEVGIFDMEYFCKLWSYPR